MERDPRPAERRTRDGRGPRWDARREAALERDDHTCQRCGYRQESRDPDLGLEVHDSAAHGTASPSDLDALVTVCRPCHATLHADDPAYGDLGEAAPLFPRPGAPAAVATMQTDRQHVCQRCQRMVDSATHLAASVPRGQLYVLCEPCAGALLAAGRDPERFEVAGDLDAGALCARADEAPVRPALLAAGPVRAPRPPETDLERLLYDTPLRHLANPVGMTALFVVVACFVLAPLRRTRGPASVRNRSARPRSGR